MDDYPGLLLRVHTLSSLLGVHTLLYLFRRTAPKVELAVNQELVSADFDKQYTRGW